MDKLSQQLEDSVQLICEQLAYLREEVASLKRELQDEVYPRLRPRQPNQMSTRGMEALERLARIRRESSS